MKKLSKEILEQARKEIFSDLGKRSKKKHPLTKEKSLEMNAKRWNKQTDLSPDSPIA